MYKLGTIIISDIHCTKVFDQKKCDYILKLLDRCEQVIVNGDMWSYYLQEFDTFVESKWSQLFPALKAKHCVYIHQQDGTSFYITHGHLISGDSIQNETYIRLNRAVFDFNRLNRSYKLYILLNKLLLKILKESKYSGIQKCLNKPHYKFATTLPGNQILVAGHTHSPEFSPEKRYINVGFINFGLAYYLNITKDKYSLEYEHY